MTFTLTTTLPRRSSPPYLPTKDSYSPTHPDCFRIQFADEGEFNSCLKTERAFAAGETITAITNTLPGVKAYSSVQVLPDPPIPGSSQDPSKCRHIELNSDLLYVNHSCDPNVAFDVRKEGNWEVRALKDLPKGEIMTFAYFSTEWDMDQPFTCLCGSSKCLGTIRGAKDIPAEVLKTYFINDHILALKSYQTQQTSASKGGKAVKGAPLEQTAEVQVGA
ncbi:hypothetical protein BCR35DRAFT_308172 [Leucosporidium creatinivorum]|uniref:Post-SET domain-containing protein n=1 Tax=Leucosporidium creatinivorum TaxID=106004 RepID=A0A1Y2EC59_9BASI|nr:hypothetical protein BCR35DRAFT_308172 [Leucosporidium creatinivorum]